MINVYTDASANNQFGCAGFTVYENHKVTREKLTIYKNVSATLTELLAVLEALTTYPEQSIKIYSDSKYVVETLNGNYKIKKYKDLWKVAKHYYEKNNSQIIHVKAHGKNERNNRIDKKVRNTLRGYTKKEGVSHVRKNA